MLAYPAWCAALIHGLYAGRSAKPIFVILYSLALLGVMGAPRAARRAAPGQAQGRRPARGPVRQLERPGLDELDASRSRVAESALPGSGGRREPRQSPADTGTAPLYQTPAAPAAEPASGFAAAYRAVSTPGRPQQPFTADRVARADLPLDLQPTEAIPRVDGPLQHLGQLADPVPAAGRRGPAVRVRPAPGHRLHHPGLRQSGHAGIRRK